MWQFFPKEQGIHDTIIHFHFLFFSFLQNFTKKNTVDTHIGYASIQVFCSSFCWPLATFRPLFKPFTCSQTQIGPPTIARLYIQFEESFFKCLFKANKVPHTFKLAIGQKVPHTFKLAKLIFLILHWWNYFSSV